MLPQYIANLLIDLILFLFQEAEYALDRGVDKRIGVLDSVLFPGDLLAEMRAPIE